MRSGSGEVRLTGGVARSRVLQVPDRPGVRPTASRVREAIFSVVGQDLTGVRVLDAFGGSGVLAAEAWSRGAEVVVVERDARTAQAISENLRGLRCDVRLVVGDLHSVLAGLGMFDGILADPPYADDPMQHLPALAAQATAWLVYEARAGRPLPRAVGDFRCERVRAYGDCALHVYARDA